MIGRSCCWLIVFLLSQVSVTQAQLADEKCKFLGNIIAGSVPADFTTYWNQITPENAGKWGSVEATRDVMNWGALDIAYTLAMNNDYPFKQHTFVWGQQQPAWISALPAAEQKEEVEEWIKAYCERYPNTAYIDVVNEPLHAVPDYATALGTGSFGWIEWTFEKARQYCPNAKLALNDYNIISSNGATDTYLLIINALKTKNLIDIIGEQGHFLETTSNETIEANLDRLFDTGIPIHISEYDVNLADDNEQRDKFVSQFPVLWTHPGVQGVTLWGYKQGQIWRQDAYLVRSDNSERPALTWLKGYIPNNAGGFFCKPTAVDEEADLNIFPNPSTTGRFTVRSKGEACSIRVLDILGRPIQRIKTSEQSLEIILDASRGIYFLEVITDKKRFVKKLIVE
jgi:endo-1,4-beta-xylanase